MESISGWLQHRSNFAHGFGGTAGLQSWPSKLAGDSELWRTVIAFETRMDFFVPDLRERTDRQADGATVVFGEIIPATGMIDALKSTVAAWLRLIVNRADRTFANAFVAHGAKIPNP